MLGELANGEVVFLCPAFLEADDIGSRCSGGNAVADLYEASLTISGKVFEAPAIQSKYVEGFKRER